MKLIFQCLSNETAENYDRPGGKFRTVSGIRHDAVSSRCKRTVIAPTLRVRRERLSEARNLQEQEEDEWEEKTHSRK